jgi:hypothetical protein
VQWGAHIATVTLAAGCAGCAINATAVRSDEALDATSAYVYGRFLIRAVPSTMGEKGRPTNQTVGLVLACDDGSTYPLYFSAEREVRVVKIQPARCAVHEIRYVNDLGIFLKSKAPPSAWVHMDYFAPGHAYYLGDFSGVASYQTFADHDLLTWDLDPVDGQFTETTDELRKRFAGVGALPIHDQRLAPGRPPLKRGLAGADEPTMSPERISRLAGFVKSTFPSPAACATACRAGDCLPYRGPSGPAMTCIHHCMTNRDCPAGWVCNCSDRPGADCQFVATTPGDSMEGICMPAGTVPAASAPTNH